MLSLNFAVAVSASIMLDQDVKPVSTSLQSGMITLTGDALADAFTMSAAKTEVTVGETGDILVPVTAETNPGYVSGLVDVLWDADALTLKKVEYTKLAPDNGSADIVSDGSYRVSFGNYLATKDFAGKGTLFTLVFTPKADLPAGEYAILLAKPSLLNYNLKNVPVTVQAGAVLLKEQTTTTTTTTTTTSTTTTTTTTSKPTTTTTTTASTNTTTTTTNTTTTTTSTNTTTTTTTTGTTTTTTNTTTTTTSTNTTTMTTTTGTTTTTATNTTTTTTSTNTTTTSTTTVTTTTSSSTTSTISTGTTTSSTGTTTTTSTSSETTTTLTTGSTTDTTSSSTTTTTTTTEIQPPEYLFGDVDMNGKVNADDAQMALIAYINQLASKPSGLTELQEQIADVDGNGKITAEDAQYILIYAVQALANKNPQWSDIIK